MREGFLGLDVRIGATAVRFSWTLLIPIPFVVASSFTLDALYIAVVGYVAYLTLIVAHELGHALAVRAVGEKVLGIDVHAFHGLCRHTTPYLPWKQIAISWGGVAAQVPLLIVAYVLWRFVDLPSMFAAVPICWGPINVAMIAFNLLPAHPLDGVIAWQAVPLAIARVRGRQAHKSPSPRLVQSTKPASGKVVPFRRSKR